MTAYHTFVFLFYPGQSRRDDVESVGYVLLFMLNGTLPWAGTMNNKASATTNQSKEQRVFAIKSTMPVPEICKDAPRLFHITKNCLAFVINDDCVAIHS